MPAYISDSLSATGSVVLPKSSRARNATYTISGTYGTVTFVFEGSTDNVSYAPCAAILVSTAAAANGTISPADNATLIYQVLCPDVQYVRLRVTAIASGTVAVVGTSDDLSVGGNVNPDIALASADGAVNLKAGTVLITKGSAAALTLAAPTAGTDDGKVLNVIATTAHAHTLTQTTPGFNNGSTASDVGTWTAAIGNGLSLVAYNGVWYTLSVRNVTLA